MAPGTVRGGDMAGQGYIPPAESAGHGDHRGGMGRRLADLIVSIARAAAEIEMRRNDLRTGEGVGLSVFGNSAEDQALSRRVREKLDQAERALEAATADLAEAFDALGTARGGVERE